MKPTARLLVRGAVLMAVGGLAGFAGGIAGVVVIARAAEAAQRRAVADSARLLGLAGKLGHE